MDEDKTDVSDLIQRLRNADPQAFESLWKRFYPRILGLARRRLEQSDRRVTDEEDIAVNALQSFFRRVQDGQFPNVRNDVDLWKLLAVITNRKCLAQRRHILAQRRGSGVVRGDSIFLASGGGKGAEQAASFDCFAADTPGSSFLVAAKEVLDQLLGRLRDTNRDVAILKLEGYSNAEIAESLSISPRTVTRKLNLIRDCWICEYDSTTDAPST